MLIISWAAMSHSRRGPNRPPCANRVGLYSYALRTSIILNHPRRIHYAPASTPLAGAWPWNPHRRQPSPKLGRNSRPAPLPRRYRWMFASQPVRLAWLRCLEKHSAGRLQPLNDPSCAVPQAPRRLPAHQLVCLPNPPPPPHPGGAWFQHNHSRVTFTEMRVKTL